MDVGVYDDKYLIEDRIRGRGCGKVVVTIQNSWTNYENHRKL